MQTSGSGMQHQVSNLPGGQIRIREQISVCLYSRQSNRPEAAMGSFDQLLTLLGEIPDPRRAQGKLYQLP
jgi:hypothetical protein